ncbi:MAG: alkane 1-monooxygenase [Gammaproteobacteria bacterium]|nr:alkane 1-monooxygenase [Gammaproteobacteria bacterium]
MNQQRIIALKKPGYLAFLIVPLLPLISYHLGKLAQQPGLFAWLTVFFVFGVIPLADFLIGQDPSNPTPEQMPALEEDRWYRYLVLSCVPLMTIVLVWGGVVFVSSDLSVVGKLGWALSIGIVSGVLAINGSHELIHKSSKLEQFGGGFLLSLVCYAGFKVEHVRGHHVNVSTPLDASSSHLNQSLYHFLPRAWFHNCRNAWRLEADRLQYRGHSAWGWHNELVWWYSISLFIAAGFYFFLGWPGLAFFVFQAFAAILFLEIVNYLEHYGLQRKRLENGRYERTTHLHSWNSNFLLTNLLLFQLQRHSDHHENPRRAYQLLRHYEQSPQLPAGYASMMLLALIPPLWRKIMNPRVEAFNQQLAKQGA